MSNNRTPDTVSQRRASRRGVRVHSGIVRLLRFVLPVCCVALVSAYAVVATPQEFDPTFEAQFANLDSPTRDLRMEKPRFSGEDASGLPFEIVAGAAIQSPENPTVITLDRPQAIRSADANDHVEVTAVTGEYNTSERRMNLAEDVVLTRGISGNSYVLRTDRAIVDIEGRTVQSDVRVDGEGATGTITADGMVAYEKEGRVVFTDAHMRLTPKRKDEPDAAPEETGEETPDT